MRACRRPPNGSAGQPPRAEHFDVAHRAERFDGVFADPFPLREGASLEPPLSPCTASSHSGRRLPPSRPPARPPARVAARVAVRVAARRPPASGAVGEARRGVGSAQHTEVAQQADGRVRRKRSQGSDEEVQL